MNTFVQKPAKILHISLIFSLILTFFVFPAPAKAGLLSSFLNAVRPLTHIAGRVGGAVVGATMASAIVPPLGMIAGGILGWIAGGIITDYATASLTNLAILGAGVAGAMALGPSAIGMVGGFLVGGFLGKVAMGLIYKTDRFLTGGLLFNKATPSGSTEALAPVAPAATTATVANAQTPAVQGNTGLKEAQEKYLKAYQAYIKVTQNGAETPVVQKALKEYQSAFQAYQQLQVK